MDIVLKHYFQCFYNGKRQCATSPHWKAHQHNPNRIHNPCTPDGKKRQNNALFWESLLFCCYSAWKKKCTSTKVDPHLNPKHRRNNMFVWININWLYLEPKETKHSPVMSSRFPSSRWLEIESPMATKSEMYPVAWVSENFSTAE